MNEQKISDLIEQNHELFEDISDIIEKHFNSYIKSVALKEYTLNLLTMIQHNDYIKSNFQFMYDRDLEGFIGIADVETLSYCWLLFAVATCGEEAQINFKGMVIDMVETEFVEVFEEVAQTYEDPSKGYEYKDRFEWSTSLLEQLRREGHSERVEKIKLMVFENNREMLLKSNQISDMHLADVLARSDNTYADIMLIFGVTK